MNPAGESELDYILCKKRKIGGDDNSSSDSEQSDTPKKELVGYSCEEDVKRKISRKGLYGLDPQFLENLGITPPLDRWVQVTNFRCDKTELRDVLELAGQVIICNIVTYHSRCARAMYSHPLEAVQAVSMLNGQTLYGQQLKVIMVCASSSPTILPKGLSEVGPGLGAMGKPLIEVVKHYRKFLKHQPSELNLKIFGKSDDEDIKDILKNEELSQDEDSDDDKSCKSSVKEEACSKPLGNNMDDPSERVHKKVKLNSKNSSLSNRSSSNTSSRNETPSPYLGKTGPIIFNASLNNNAQKNAQYNMGQRMVQPSSFCPPFERPDNTSHPLQPIGPMHNPVRPAFHQVAPNATGTFDTNKTIGPMNPVRPLHSAPAIGHPGHSLANNFMPVRPLGPIMNVPIRPPAGQYVAPHIMPNSNLVPMPGRASALPGEEGLVVSFSNLPPTTTFRLLSDKVSICGQVLSLQLTTPGCAVARFGQKAHAEVCYQMFKGKCIDGCIIDVRID